MTEAAEPLTCVVCGDGDASVSRFGLLFEVRRCRRCGHCTSSLPAQEEVVDYHEQYEAGAFLEALEATRRAQSRRILDRLEQWVPELDGLLDLGAGRGWFLEACQQRGVQHLAGADASAVSTSLLRQRGLEAIELPDLHPASLARALGRLTFAPRVLTLLDVLEHLPPTSLRRDLEQVLRDMPRLELLVVKVPVNDGLLYALSEALARLGWLAPLRQLYQVGTWPPHLHYFSRRSLRQLLGGLGWEIAAEQPELEFEPATLVSRVRALRRAPRWLATGIGAGIALAVRASGRYDSVVVFARPAPRG